MGYNMYTSEPDLRFTDSRQHPPMDYQLHHHYGDNGAVKGRMSRSKKKYRAPQIPPSSSHYNGVSVINLTDLRINKHLPIQNQLVIIIRFKM